MTTSCSNYMSIDDIISTNERIPCKFQVQVQRLGFLDSSSDTDHIQPNTKLELPFWLATALCNRRRHIVAVDMPKQYKEGYREILTADANVVDLHKLGPYYYTFGSHLLCFELPETPDIAKSLLQTFQSRLRKIMDASQNAYYEDTTNLTAKLDEMERDLFKCGQQGLRDFQRWETRASEQLKTSEMVINHRKRKRAVMEETS
ncbi:DNA replication complex GINS protein PSF3 [Lingula anatina]|uniref:DNA replication complex GINS protein PSF3 n=1 Tax=Lingula anatina TaxID=7574 RepID=A0A1S3GZP2_LINAN|nr:DNA replication complex GINS protein PSF3 [Lingula anatina]|eukprot:XP_013379345.1 DNA replication complex GINS protein PSF3 [Lingula anatina]